MADRSLYQAPDKKPMSESKEVALWQERISIAKKAKDAWIEESGAKRFTREYNGHYDLFFNGLKGKIPVPPINEVFSYVQSDIAGTYNRDPYIAVNAKAGTPEGAKLWEVWLNYQWRALQIKEEMELEIIDKDLAGSAWHKVGMAIQSIGTGDQLKISSEKLYSLRVDYKDVLWNVGAKRPPKDCQWMAQRIVRPLDDIKKAYPKTAKGMTGVPHPDVDKADYDKVTYKDDIKVGVMYEIWDARAKKVLLIGEGINDRYLEPPKNWPDYLDEFPFLQYWDFWKPDSAYPMSAIAPWEAQILERMILLAQAINHAKRWNRQLFIKGGTVDDNALDKFERGDDGAIITVNGNMDDASFKFADFGPMPTDFYLLMDRLQQIEHSIHGQPEFQQGGVTKTNTRTIGELELMSQGAKGRQDRKIDRLETHLSNIARQMLMHGKANFDGEQIVKVTGDTPQEVLQLLQDHYDPATKTIRFSPEEIEGEYDVDVKAGSTLPLDKQTRTKIFEAVLQTVAAAVSNGPVSPFLNALITEMLDGYDIKSLQIAFQQEQQQKQQQMQMEMEAHQTEVQKTQAEAAKRGAQAQHVAADAEMLMQDAQLGPIFRALIEKMKKEQADRGPSETIAFKDLPETGQVQMAAQAGIHLSPEEAPGVQKPVPAANGAAQ